MADFLPRACFTLSNYAASRRPAAFFFLGDCDLDKRLRDVPQAPPRRSALILFLRQSFHQQAGLILCRYGYQFAEVALLRGGDQRHDTAVFVDHLKRLDPSIEPKRIRKELGPSPIVIVAALSQIRSEDRTSWILRQLLRDLVVDQLKRSTDPCIVAWFAPIHGVARIAMIGRPSNYRLQRIEHG